MNNAVATDRYTAIGTAAIIINIVAVIAFLNINFDDRIAAAGYLT